MKARFISFWIVLFFTASFIWGYVEWTCPIWGYMGFSYLEQPTSRVLTIYFFSLLPLAWMPVHHVRPTVVIYWLIYLLTYIPMLVGVGFAAYFDANANLMFSLACALSFFLNGVFYFMPVVQMQRPFLNLSNFWVVYSIIALSFVGYIFYVYRGNLSFVNPFDVNLYDKRASGSNLGKGTGVGYPIMWSAGAFFPFILAYGIYYKNRMLLLLSIVGYVYLFLTQADKAFLFQFIWVLMMFQFMKRTKLVGQYFGLVFGGITTILTALYVFGDELMKLAVFPICTTIFVRLTGVSAFTSTIYYNFFEDSTNPYTYFSHVNVFNKFITYPYDDMIGKVVASTISTNPDFNANANYFITDGLCSMGLWGIPIAGLLCGLVLHAIDSVANRHDLRFATMVITYSSVNIMNASIFTSVLSGGLIWIFLFFLLMKPKPRVIQIS
jgi:hypothetical protein